MLCFLHVDRLLLTVTQGGLQSTISQRHDSGCHVQMISFCSGCCCLCSLLVLLTLLYFSQMACRSQHLGFQLFHTCRSGHVNISFQQEHSCHRRRLGGRVKGRAGSWEASRAQGLQGRSECSACQVVLGCSSLFSFWWWGFECPWNPSLVTVKHNTGQGFLPSSPGC